MKKVISYALVILAMCVSCRKIGSEYSREGVLSFEGFDVVCDNEVISRAVSPADGSYVITINDESGKRVVNTTYSEIKAGSGRISLLAGRYVLEVRSSADEVPAAVFGKPVYGCSEEFVISVGETTVLGSLVCTLLQVKATVSYDDSFLEMVTGDGVATVSVNPANALEYKLSYNDGNVGYDDSEGYFAVNNGSKTTMNVIFSGNIEGENRRMVANLTNVSPRQWCQIRFVKKVDTQGNATFSVEIDDYFSDEEIIIPLEVAREETIGVDPEAPRGDGGISVEFMPDCTMFDSLSDIRVPSPDVPMDLRLGINVPDGVGKMVVEMSSTNQSFIEALSLAGGTTLDLLNPTPDQEVVFQIVPFPHGPDLAGRTALIFDLSAAQIPILAFAGEHTFVLKIMDVNGCSKSVPVVLKVIE